VAKKYCEMIGISTRIEEREREREREEEDLLFVRVDVTFANLNDAIDRCSRRHTIRIDTLTRVASVAHVTVVVINATGFFRHVVLVFIVRMANTAL